MTLLLKTQTSLNLPKRMRRNRMLESVRTLVEETHLHSGQLVAPLFLTEEGNEIEKIPSMPGTFRWPLSLLVQEVEQLASLGIQAINLFPKVPIEKKDRAGSYALNENNLVTQAVRLLKKEVPQVCLMVDIALDPYTDHGHDGIVSDRGEILNDATVLQLTEMALLLAEAGADIVAPSDMMDGRIRAIRETLDHHNFSSVGILSYAAKYASSFYGPFREALNSAPRFGDKKSYQLNPANSREALLESLLDEQEGADMLMVKPALPYLDILTKLRELTYLPLAAYQVSGEYAMIQAAAQQGWIDGKKVLLESLLSIKRAGADFILTYGAKEAATLLA